ncbi:MAG TPA: glucosaminidase domain-containing protein [Ktedonobacteraceae bacterium]|nr:glucosaminidase domain-containing protein [Ktedonobacteraceae bacterium]
MPKARKQHKRRSFSHKKRPSLSSRAFLIGALLIFIALLAGWWLNRSAGRDLLYDTHYEVMGAPSIDVNQINQVLDFYGSPAHDKGQALYDLGVQYGVDPIYALAFFQHESRFGTTGVATVTHSLGNIRATPGYESFDGYRKYKTWEAGFEDWYKLITVQYVEKWKLVTVDQIIPVYAPSSDHNDVDAYIQSIKDAVTIWRSGQVQV